MRFAVSDENVVMTDETHTTKFKVLWADGFAREIVADQVVQENMSEVDATVLCSRLRSESKWDGDWWKVVPQDARVWRGIEELI